MMEIFNSWSLFTNIFGLDYKFLVKCECAQGSMLQSIERYMKQAIVDKEPSVSSAALTSSLVSPDEITIVYYWIHEIAVVAVGSINFSSFLSLLSLFCVHYRIFLYAANWVMHVHEITCSPVSLANISITLIEKEIDSLKLFCFKLVCLWFLLNLLSVSVLSKLPSKFLSTCLSEFNFQLWTGMI